MQTREEWLAAASAKMAVILGDEGQKIPEKIRFAVGFAKYGKPKAIGQCWAPENTGDGTTHIFICPTLSEPITVLSTCCTSSFTRPSAASAGTRVHS